MPKASEIAAELRKFADSLDTNAEVEVEKAHLYFSSNYTIEPKPKFLAVAKLLPRPMKKSDGYSHDEVKLVYDNETIQITAIIKKSEMCRLLKPAQAAVYECDPILSQAEEDSLIEA